MDVSQLIPLECECHLPGKAEHVTTYRGVGELCGGVASSGAEPRAEESVQRPWGGTRVRDAGCGFGAGSRGGRGGCGVDLGGSWKTLEVTSSDCGQKITEAAGWGWACGRGLGFNRGRRAVRKYMTATPLLETRQAFGSSLNMDLGFSRGGRPEGALGYGSCGVRQGSSGEADGEDVVTYFQSLPMPSPLTLTLKSCVVSLTGCYAHGRCGLGVLPCFGSWGLLKMKPSGRNTT